LRELWSSSDPFVEVCGAPTSRVDTGRRSASHLASAAFPRPAFGKLPDGDSLVGPQRVSMLLDRWFDEAMSTVDDDLRTAIEVARRRVVAQIGNLQQSFTAIVEAAELTSTDDEHDPEGATIAYERAQVWALLQRAHGDLEALDDAIERIDGGTFDVCVECAGPIAIERLMALPGVRTCIRCAR
jgi:RNA polymerase-binding transcription factor DksA